MKFQECEKEIPREETQNKYGDAARNIEIGAIAKHYTFIRIQIQRYRNGDLREGEFVYKIKRKQIKDGHTVTGSCISEKRK